MAITKAPILHGAKGRLDGIYMRQEFGNTILASMPRKRSKSSRMQRTQNSFFHLAVKCLKYVPMYAQYAYIRNGLRSPYNMCVSALVSAFRALGVIDLTPNFLCLCNTLVSSDGYMSEGSPTADVVAFAEGVGDSLTLTINAVAPATLCVWLSEDGHFGSLQISEVQTGHNVLTFDNVKCCMVLLRRDDEPIQMLSREAIYVKP